MLDVGSVSARLGALFDDDGFDRFDRAVDRAKRQSNDVKPTQLKGDYDATAFKKYDRAAHDVDRSSGRMVGALGKSGIAFRAVGTGALAGAAGAGLAAKSIIGTATDINESLAKNEVLFGKHAKSVEQFSNSSAKSFGISKAAALEATGTFGNLFTALEIGPKKSADMSVSLTKLAADLASFNNASPEEALEAIRSGLVGETEPLRKFGVNLNDAALRAEALSQGLVKNTKEALDPQTKALAVNALLFKQTKSAKDDFARTSSGLANQQRILKARLSDVGAEIGGKLLPVVTKGATALNDLLSGKGSGATRGLSQAVGRVFGEVKGVIQGAMRFVGQVFRDNRRDLDRLLAGFRSLVTPVRQAIGKIVAAFREAFGSDGGIGKDIRSIIKALVGFYVTFETKIGIPIIKRILPGIVQAFQGFARIIRGVVQLIAGILTGDFGKAWTGVKNIFSGAIKSIGGIIRAGTAPLRAAAAAVGKAVGGAFSSAWGSIKRTAVGFINDIIDVINKIPGIPKIGHVGGGGGGSSQTFRGSSLGAPDQASRGNPTAQHLREGGKVTMPVAIMGEEAPQHPEWVIPTNPAYRSRAVGLWMAAARELGIPGFSVGGVFQDVGGALGGAAKGLAGGAKAVGETALGAATYPVRKLIDLLPDAPGGILGGAFSYAREKAIDYIKSKATSLLPGGGGGGSAHGLVGTVLAAIAWARANGWGGSIVDGFRTRAEQARLYSLWLAGKGNRAAPPGQGNHERGQAIDVSDTEGFARAMASAPDGARLYRRVAGEPWHFSVTGFAKGGKLSKLASAYAERASRGMGGFEDAISGMERRYGQLDRQYGLSDENFVVENDAGGYIDQGAVKHRTDELGKLTARRSAIRQKILAYRTAVQKAVRLYRLAISRLERATKAAKGKGAGKLRKGYAERIKAYRARIGELGGKARDLTFDAEDSALDLRQLRQEIAALDPRILATQLSTPEAASAADLGGADAEPAPAAEAEPAVAEPTGPTPEQIAQAAAQQLAAFNADRAELFAGFGSNFNRAGASMFGSDTQRAAGLRYFGAEPADAAGALEGSGGGTSVVVNQTFQAPPPDPHSWSRGLAWEVRQAI